MWKWLLYWVYSRHVEFQRWFARRFTLAGQLVMAGIVAAALVGADTTLNVAHLAFVLLAMLLAVSMFTCFFRPPRLDAERVLPRFGTLGTPIRYDLHLTNLSRSPQLGLTIFEDLPDPLPSLKDFIETPEPGEEERNFWDRGVAYYRWLWLVSQRTVGIAKESLLKTCPAKGRVSVSLELLPVRRGVLRLEGITMGAPDPFGLVRALRRKRLPQSVLILPRRYWLPPMALPGARKYQRGGVALASSVGESDEFVSLREYRPGDPLKHIHWRSWARMGEPIVKEFQDEFFVRHALILDTFSTMKRQAAFEEAVSVAASFACTLHTQESLLDLMFVGAEAYCFTMGRGLAHVEQILEVLAGVNLCSDQPFSALPELIGRHLDGICGCILVLIEWDRERIEFVRQLQTLGLPLRVMVVAEAREARLIEASLHSGNVPAHLLEVGRIQEGLLKLAGTMTSATH